MEISMSKKQLSLLFVCSLVPWTMASGYMPILPIYLLRFGITQVEAGYFISICFGFLAVGTFFAGWLADRFQHRKLM